MPCLGGDHEGPFMTKIVDWLIRESGRQLGSRLSRVQFYCMPDAWKLSIVPAARRDASLPLDELAGSLAFRQPLGVVGVISPWNFPMYLSQPFDRPGTGVGNAFVIKPAEDTPSRWAAHRQIYERPDCHPVLNVVIDLFRIGDGPSRTQRSAPHLVHGSTRVGRHIERSL